MGWLLLLFGFFLVVVLLLAAYMVMRRKYDNKFLKTLDYILIWPAILNHSRNRLPKTTSILIIVGAIVVLILFVSIDF